MKKIAIIGAGIFGCSAALELIKNDNYNVTLFEGDNDILTGASTKNQLRHHYGFHYPRSRETVEEIKAARENFEKEYGECISELFDDYYAVSTINSKTTPKDFIRFCNELNLQYEVAWPKERFMNRTNIGICIKTPERVYDPDILKGLLLRKIRGTNIKLKLNHKIVGGEINGKNKSLIIKINDKILEENFDYVINATYSNFNNFNKWFNFPRKKIEYELMELLELYIPLNKKIALTIMDGDFATLVPRGEKGTFSLGHVKESVLKRVVSDDLDPVVMASENTKSNKEKILGESIKYYPFLKDAEVVKSMFVTRAVKANVSDTDERPSEITDYGNGMYSIFGGKVITCVNIAKKIADLIKQEENKI